MNAEYLYVVPTQSEKTGKTATYYDWRASGQEHLDRAGVGDASTELIPGINDKVNQLLGLNLLPPSPKPGEKIGGTLGGKASDNYLVTLPENQVDGNGYKVEDPSSKTSTDYLLLAGVGIAGIALLKLIFGR